MPVEGLAPWQASTEVKPLGDGVFRIYLRSPSFEKSHASMGLQPTDPLIKDLDASTPVVSTLTDVVRVIQEFELPHHEALLYAEAVISVLRRNHG